VSKLTIDHVLALIRVRLDLSKETEHELLAEMRTHLEEAVAQAQAKGIDEEVALLKAAEKFGLDQVGPELQEVHAAWESADAILAAALPVVCALVLRWLVFAPDGTALGWPELLNRPAFWIVSLAALLLPLLQFRRWRYALVAWCFFWVITVAFVALPVVGRW
jgi:hypothetical protein